MKSLAKLLKIMLVILMLCSVSVVSLSCGSDSESEAAAYQLATVTMGSLTVDISASGNLALSVMEDLAFEMAGTVEEVMVAEGDSVTEGQVLARLDTSEWEEEIASLRMALLEAEINLENAEMELEDAEDDSSTTTGDIATTTDSEELAILELKVEKAQYSYDKAQEALDEAMAASPEVVAPFDGFITAVNIEGGDEITKGTIAVTIADPDKFEADIYVSELDIADVAVGSSATVGVDALSITVPAEVTHISSTATVSSGVVNYTVKVELDSLDSLIEAQTAMMPEMTSGDFSEGMQGPSGEMTEEELAAMREQMAQAQAEQLAALEDIQLRAGMTVTVSIIVAERTDVLLVPIGAILTAMGQTYVQVMADDGTIEDRTVTVGVSNWQYTEVTDGLSEGEQVVVPEGTTTTTTDTMFPGGGMMGGSVTINGGGMPGGGGTPPQ